MYQKGTPTQLTGTTGEHEHSSNPTDNDARAPTCDEDDKDGSNDQDHEDDEDNEDDEDSPDNAETGGE